MSNVTSRVRIKGETKCASWQFKFHQEKTSQGLIIDMYIYGLIQGGGRKEGVMDAAAPFVFCL